MYPMCRSCARWRSPPPERMSKPVGTCKLDNSLRHAGASVCGSYTVPAAQAPRLAGLSDSEVAWLQAHPTSRYTQSLRASILRLSRAPLSAPIRDHAFALVDAWRAEPDYLAIPRSLAPWPPAALNRNGL